MQLIFVQPANGKAIKRHRTIDRQLHSLTRAFIDLLISHIESRARFAVAKSQARKARTFVARHARRDLPVNLGLTVEDVVSSLCGVGIWTAADHAAVERSARDCSA